MKDLFASEWRRFRRLVLVVATVHALVLVFLSRAMDLLQRGYQDHLAMLFVYMLLGLVLGLVQLGSYRKPSQWLWLIHRPLPPAKIFAAIALSALAMLAAALFAPLLVFVAATDLFTTQVVDVRHYLAPVHVLLFATMAWLAGAHASVSRHKTAVAVLVVPLLLALHLISAWTLFIPVLLCTAWLAWIALHGFRADREAPIARPGVLLLTALPLQLASFLLVFHLARASIEVVDLLRPRYPSKTMTQANPDVDAYMRTLAQDFFIAGLRGSRDPRAAGWREQIPLLDIAQLVPEIERFPVRHQASNLPTSWYDETHRVEWTFSHDAMRFRGRDPKTGEDRGWWGERGAGSARTFPHIPMAGLSRDTLYAIDTTTQRQHVMVRLPAGEWFTGPPVRELDRLFLLTNKRVLAYRPARDATAAFAPPVLDWSLAVSDGATPVQVSVAQLLDGWLVSAFRYTSSEFAGFESLATQTQAMHLIDDTGRSTPVAMRRVAEHGITLGGTPAVPKSSWWVSPVLYVFARAPETLFDEGLTHPVRVDPVPTIRLFYPLAAALLLLSLSLAWWWTRGAGLSASRRRWWLAACALLGLPAFLSMLCIERRAPRCKRPWPLA
jgi:hypothetical protein